MSSDRSPNAIDSERFIEGSNDDLLNPGKTIQNDPGIVRSRVASVLRSFEGYPWFIDLVFLLVNICCLFIPGSLICFCS